jgi:hypothetical protein
VEDIKRQKAVQGASEKLDTLIAVTRANGTVLRQIRYVLVWLFIFTLPTTLSSCRPPGLHRPTEGQAEAVITLIVLIIFFVGYSMVGFSGWRTHKNEKYDYYKADDSST